MIYHEAVEIFSALNISRHDELKKSLIHAAVRYARIRVDWHEASPQARNDMDIARTCAHEFFIDTCNILSRGMAAAGEDIGWREKLGGDRKEIGDFACYLHCILGIEAR
jgi:hypothetical protein